MPVIVFFSNKLFAVAVSVVSLLVAGPLVYVASISPHTPRAEASSVPVTVSDTVFLSAVAASDSIREDTRVIVQEVHVAANGLTLLRGARVVSVSKRLMRVKMTWGTQEFVWRVHIDANTRYTSQSGVTGDDEMHVDEFVTVTGMLVHSGNEPEIHASYIRTTR